MDINADGWRLPTEAEWEYLARAGNLNTSGQLKYSGTDSDSALNEYAWYSENPDTDKSQRVNKTIPRKIVLNLIRARTRNTIPTIIVIFSSVVDLVHQFPMSSAVSFTSSATLSNSAEICSFFLSKVDFAIFMFIIKNKTNFIVEIYC